MLYIIIILISCFFSSFLGTKAVLVMLNRIKLMDIPNERSNHKAPIPRGGGVAIFDTLLVAFIVISFFITNDFTSVWPVMAAGTVLAGISFVDDIKSISASIRFPVQIFAVAVGIVSLGQDALLFNGLLPSVYDHILSGIIWLWFINLYNFMDGIDGITGSETASITGGICLLALLSFVPMDFAYYSAAIFAVALGFLMLNWHPAKIFMGDVGSVTLGYLIGWLLIKLAAQGHYIPAIILPAYYFSDSGITILRRLLNGEKIWQAHSKHFYQKAIREGKRSHSEVVKLILLTNFVLIVVTIWYSFYPEKIIFTIIFAFLAVFMLLYALGKKKF